MAFVDKPFDILQARKDTLACSDVIHFNNREPAEIKQALAAQKINVSTSKGSGNLVSFRSRGLTEVVRASVHYFNTESEIDCITYALSKIVTRFHNGLLDAV